MKKNNKKLTNKLFKHRRTLKKEAKHNLEYNAWRIIYLLKKNNEPVSGRRLGEILGVEPRTIREAIQFIRERNHIFSNPTNDKYIVATEYGYQLSNDFVKLKAYYKKLKTTLKSKKKQLGEIEIALINKRRKNG